MSTPPGSAPASGRRTALVLVDEAEPLVGSFRLPTAAELEPGPGLPLRFRVERVTLAEDAAVGWTRARDFELG